MTDAYRVSHCIGCGCHDFAACVEEATGMPCSWIAVDAVAAVGVCSSCPEAMTPWNQGVRTAPRTHGLFTSLLQAA